MTNLTKTEQELMEKIVFQIYRWDSSPIELSLLGQWGKEIKWEHPVNNERYYSIAHKLYDLFKEALPDLAREAGYMLPNYYGQEDDGYE